MDRVQNPKNWEILEYAISLREPWIYAILHLGKDIENRRWKSNFTGRLYLHASKTFDHAGYDHLVNVLKLKLPKPHEFRLGGIVGAIDIDGYVVEHESMWFQGPFGYVLKNPKELQFKYLKGRLGIFSVDLE